MHCYSSAHVGELAEIFVLASFSWFDADCVPTTLCHIKVPSLVVLDNWWKIYRLAFCYCIELVGADILCVASCSQAIGECST
jgi:hypothetical protein